MMILGAVILFVMPAQPVRAEQGVTVGFGTLNIGGIFQATGMYSDANDSSMEFKLKRARLLLSGTLIPDRVKFFVQTEGVSSPYVLDSKMIFQYIPQTEIVFGRFLPNFSLYMPSHTGKLDFINYPLVNTKYAMWRQTGLQTQSKTEYVDITAGVFNGYQFDENSGNLNGNDWGDDNVEKDYLLRIDVKPLDGLKIGLYGWLGNPYDMVNDKNFTANRFGFNFRYQHETFHVAGEYIMGKTEYESEDLDNHGFFIQAGAKLMEDFELLARYDAYDRNKDIDDDEENWYTVGLNYELAKYNVKFYLNVIEKISDLYLDTIDDDKELQVVFMAQYCF